MHDAYSVVISELANIVQCPYSPLRQSESSADLENLPHSLRSSQLKTS
jgi:hypothetical protein